MAGFVLDQAAHVERLADFFTGMVGGVITAGVLAETDEEITLSQVECLKYLQRHGATTSTELAAGLGVSAPAVSKLVDRLVRRQLVARRENREDRRAVEVDLTEKGLHLIRDIRARRSDRFKQVLDRMDASQRDALEVALEAFVTAGLTSRAEVEQLCQHCGDEDDPSCPLIFANEDLIGVPLECS